eukprot:TCALIF_06119-PA protein Name:"Protein of unknown function" AED:0.16 eAED:0.29 QI:0/-1/0/1/-1/1/1/0/187
MASAIEKNRGRGVWSIINMRLGQPGQIVLEDQGGQEIKDSSQVAGCLAHFFEDKVTKFKRLPNPEEVLGILSQQYQHVDPWDLQEVSEEEVGGLIDDLPSKTSSGPDKVLYRFIKTFKFELIPAMTKVINYIVCNGKFPDNWKMARTIPLWKSNGSKKEFLPASCFTKLPGKACGNKRSKGDEPGNQ